MLIFGVRPNSLSMTISVFLSRPDWARSSISAAKARVHHFAVVAHGRESVGVHIEAAAIHLNETHALFDQSPGEQGRSAELTVAVAFETSGFSLRTSKASRAGLRISLTASVRAV